MNILEKHWSITLMTALTIVGLGVIAVGLMEHSDFLSLGIVVTMTGTGVQLIRSHFAEEARANRVIETARQLAEKVLQDAKVLAQKALDDAYATAVQREKATSTLAAVVQETKEIKKVVEEVVNKVNGQ